MEFKYKDMVKALAAVEEERSIPEEVVMEALKEAFAKAYKQDSGLEDIDVHAEINQKKKTIELFQTYDVVAEDDIEDDELQMSLEDAQEIDKNAKIGDRVSRKIEIESFSRKSVNTAKSVIRQKVREAEKVAVYDEYINQLNDMVLGIVESVKDKFTLVNLGKTVAMMPRSAEIPGETLREGQRLRVVITEVNKDTKGSQVLVSRADPMLVKRLFEKEVPEIFNGTVEIKAIAREAGERTKMAVVSHNPDVDPIGACIGPRGQRVQDIIEEIHGEKVDIFLWNDDITELVKNALAPAEVEAVLPGDDDKSLLVVVADDQLSLAIGKRGKNARLAVKLTDHKIDIKTRAAIEEMGKDYDALLAEAQEKSEAARKERERAEIAKMEEEARIAEEKRQEAVAKLLAEKKDKNAMEEEEDGFIPEEMMESMKDRISNEIAMAPEKSEEEEVVAPVEETPVEEAETEEVEVVEEAVDEEPEKKVEIIEEEPKEEVPVKTTTRKHANLEEMAAKNEYVSVFEKLTDTSKPKADEPSRFKKKKKKDDDEYKVRNKDLEKQIKEKLNTQDNRPIYTEEELAEIEAAQQAEEEKEYDFDYDEYEDYYDEDNN